MSLHSGWWKNAPPLCAIAILGSLALFFGAPPQQPVKTESRLRVAYFPNLTHAAALVGVARGDFQRAVGPRVGIDPKVFNAGPETMEALLAGELDMAFVGPGPAINTYIKTKGRALRILAGACSGGASLVSRADLHLDGVGGLNGKRVAVPQLGGTQDISLRHFLAVQGLLPVEKGGTVEILPIKNGDILALFLQGQLDAAWVPEPWATRLQQEAHARLVVDERDLWPDRKFTTTVLLVRTDFAKAHPNEVQAIVRAHVGVIAWLQTHPDAGEKIVNRELKRLTGKALPASQLHAAWNRLEFTADPNPVNLSAFIQAGREAGYLHGSGVDVANLLDTHYLREAEKSVSAMAR